MCTQGFCSLGINTPQFNKTVFQEEWNSLDGAVDLLFLIRETSYFLSIEKRALFNLSADECTRTMADA